MSPAAFKAMIEHAVADGVVSVEALLAVLQHRGGRGVEGTLLLRDTLQSGLVDEKIQKQLELLVARIVDSCRVPKPERQHRLECDDGRRFAAATRTRRSRRTGCGFAVRRASARHRPAELARQGHA